MKNHINFENGTVSFGIKFSPLATETGYYVYKIGFVEGFVFRAARGN